MKEKEICYWYIKTFHPNFYYRKKFQFNPWTFDGKQKLRQIKIDGPYKIFDRMMCWSFQDEGYEYWLCESIKLTYLCFTISKNSKSYSYLQNLLERAEEYKNNGK